MDKILEGLLERNDLIMLDTCFAMRDEFHQFKDDIENELITRNKKIIVKSAVMAELYRHIASLDEETHIKAENAINTINNKKNLFIIHEKNISTEDILRAFADVELIADFAKSRIKYRMALLTNDYKLGKDISDLNNLESCYGKKVEVFSLNNDGCLEERKYNKYCTNTSGTEVLKIEDLRRCVEIERKTDWTTIICASFASFVLGLTVDKYGKQLLNLVVKAMA